MCRTRANPRGGLNQLRRRLHAASNKRARDFERLPAVAQRKLDLVASSPVKRYGFFGLAQPKILSKNRPDIRVRNHHLENRRDCMILAPNFLSNGIIVGPIIGGVERIAPSERLPAGKF